MTRPDIVSSRAAPAISLAALAIALSTVSPATASERVLGAVYDVSFGGLKVAKAVLVATFADGAYNVDVDYKTGGVTAAVGSATGTVAASGRMTEAGPDARAFQLAGQHGKKARRTKIALAGGAVKDFASQPPIKSGGNRVPITKDVLAAASDPLSAGLIPVADPKNPLDGACDRTLRVFDGWARYDVKLARSGVTTVKSDGYRGPGVVCSARYVPVAGHRVGHETTKFWEANRDLSITYVPVPGMPVLAPARVRVATSWGTFDIWARKLSGSGN